MILVPYRALAQHGALTPLSTTPTYTKNLVQKNKNRTNLLSLSGRFSLRLSRPQPDLGVIVIPLHAAGLEQQPLQPRALDDDQPKTVWPERRLVALEQRHQSRELARAH